MKYQVKERRQQVTYLRIIPTFLKGVHNSEIINNSFQWLDTAEKILP